MSYWHTSYLKRFFNEYYKGVIDINNVVSDKVAKKVFQDIVFGREVEIDKKNGLKEKYFVREDIVDKFPIKIQKGHGVEFSHCQKVYRYITQYQSVQYIAEKCHTYREFIDTFANYKHSRPDYWLLAKIIVTCAYFDKLNARIISEASFGKDSLINIMKFLIGSTSKVVNPSVAKLKFRLLNKVIVLNEMGGLEKKKANNLAMFLLSVGDFDTEWENNTMTKNGTKEIYDIENNSFLIFHNIKSYYEKKDMTYFDDMFTSAVVDRFKGLKFQGTVTESFVKIPKQNNIADHEILEMRKSAKYFQECPEYTKKYKQNINFDFTRLEIQRCQRNFDTICKWIDRYSRSQEEYDEICMTLKEAKCYG